MASSDVRIRRDYMKVISLIKANALIHQLNRDVNEKGEIIAILEDYKVIYYLVNNWISYSVESSVPPNVRGVVNAVKELIEELSVDSVSCQQVADRLNINKSTASRNLTMAIESGYIKNLESKHGVKAKYVLDEPIIEDNSVLPHPDIIQKYIKNNKIFPVAPIYSFDQYFFDYNDIIKKKQFSEPEAYKHYMIKANNRKRSFDNDRESFYIEYGEKYLWADDIAMMEADNIS